MSEASMYRFQAACQQAEADATTLSNVREKCEDSVRAWTRMAERVEQTRAMRADQRKATALNTTAR